MCGKAIDLSLQAQNNILHNLACSNWKAQIFIKLWLNWLRHGDTSWKVVVSITDGVMEIYIV
jgi:hypothetical protein